MHFYAFLCTFMHVTHFCCDLHTFSADFLKLNEQNPQTLSLLECMPYRMGPGSGDARREAGRPFEGDLGGIRLWLLPPRRPSRHFQMVYMNMQICRARQKLVLVIFTLHEGRL